MELNVQLYGIGVGLVMCGWVAGLVVSYVFSIITHIGQLGRKP